MTADLDAAIVRAASSHLPVLLNDTCFLLDVVRDPTRDTVRPQDRGAAAALSALAARGDRLMSFMAQQVHTELADNRASVERDARDAVGKLDARLKRMDQVMAAYGTVGASAVTHLKEHDGKAKAVLDSWINGSIIATQTDVIAGLAFKRISQGRAPSGKGGSGAKDCLVIETYFDLAARLRRSGHAGPIVFASSNTSDFCQSPGSSLHGDLAAEFTALNMEFAPNFGAARHSLGL